MRNVSRLYVPALAVLAWLGVEGCRATGTCGSSKLVEEISIAKVHTCARLRDGGLKCWGINGNGQVGDGTRTHRASPALVAGLCGVTSVSTGGESTCASVEDGSVRCWGLGYADTPTEIRGIGAVVRVAMSQIQACGLRTDGSVARWGPPADRKQPSTIAITRVTHLVASKGKFSRFAARRDDGSVWRWLERDPPTQIPMASARDLSCGIRTCCALLEDTTITCWDPEDPIPAAVPGLSGVVQVAAGGARTCVVLKDRTVRCWGRDPNFGAFGDGSSGDHPTPSPIPGLTAVRQIDPGNFNGCVVLDDGTAKCWGGPTDRGGMVGDGTAEKRMTPVDVAM